MSLLRAQRLLEHREGGLWGFMGGLWGVYEGFYGGLWGVYERFMGVFVMGVFKGFWGFSRGF